MKTCALLLLSLATTVTFPLMGQVVARQGVAPVSDVILFKSPMILEFPLPDLRGIDLESRMRITRILLPDVEKYHCDNHVSLYALAITARRKGSNPSSTLEVEITGQASVIASFDRMVDIQCRIKNADAVVAEGTTRNLKTPERKHTPFSVVISMPEPDLFGTYARASAPTLEITLTVRDDS